MANMKKPTKESRLTKFMKAPLRVLIKARDFYIMSMTECSGRFDYGTVMGCPAAQVPSALPRSFSTSSTKSSTADNEDYRELMRAASARSVRNKIEFDLARKVQLPRQPPVAGVPNAIPRSRSVGIRRIDEDKMCEFDEEEEVKIKRAVYPRSRSYAVSRRTN
ncbi:hypothetical protein C1H46_000282 [Malus baccata]|uniref:Uncharacterized protein n=1 Tax=Malus baccata TaxID=106549 RepID=A0A540NUY4_MALBA|nr:hypothetical protein C1H46_000282 [Malus baccata]